jgi:glutaredoxin
MLARWFRRWRDARAPVELVLFTRADCPLCAEMKRELGRARVRPPFRLVEVDVDSDPELAARYGRSVPVLAIAGRPAFKGRLTAAEFAARYRRRLAEIRAGDASPAGAPPRESRDGRDD